MDTMIKGTSVAFIFSFMCFYWSFKIWKSKKKDDILPSYLDENWQIPLVVMGVLFLMFGLLFIVIGLSVY